MLEEVKAEKDLGLFVSENLGWDENIRSRIKNTNKCIGWISRNLINRDYKIWSRVYKTIIRRILCSIVESGRLSWQLVDHFRVGINSAEIHPP